MLLQLIVEYQDNPVEFGISVKQNSAEKWTHLEESVHYFSFTLDFALNLRRNWIYSVILSWSIRHTCLNSSLKIYEKSELF